jgi:hypothetical protein
MADTVRDLATLLALTPDNVTGLVSPQDLRDMLRSILGCYGGLYVSAGGAPQIKTLSGTPTVLAPWDGSMPLHDITVNATTGVVTIPTAGRYLVTWSLTLVATTIASPPEPVIVTLFQEGSATNFKGEVAMAAGISYQLSGNAVITAAANDELDLRISGTTNDAAGTLQAQFAVTRLE